MHTKGEKKEDSTKEVHNAKKGITEIVHDMSHKGWRLNLENDATLRQHRGRGEQCCITGNITGNRSS